MRKSSSKSKNKEIAVSEIRRMFKLAGEVFDKKWKENEYVKTTGNLKSDRVETYSSGEVFSTKLKTVSDEGYKAESGKKSTRTLR